MIDGAAVPRETLTRLASGTVAVPEPIEAVVVVPTLDPVSCVPVPEAVPEAEAFGTTTRDTSSASLRKDASFCT